MELSKKKLELLKKLQALAQDDRGNEHERNVAEKQLSILMKKYNITDEDIEEEKPKERQIWYRHHWEYLLIHQLVYAFFDDRPTKIRIGGRMVGERGFLYVDFTDAEWLEFNYMYDIYKTSLNKEMELFYTAFISKNHIYPAKPKESNSEHVNPMTMEEQMKVAMFAESISKSHIRKALDK